MGFADVGYRTVQRAGFNLWEPTLYIEVRHRNFFVYHSKLSLEPKPNLIIMEPVVSSPEMYFRTFLGNSPDEYKTEAEARLFFQILRQTINDQYKINSRNLEAAINKVIDDVETGIFPVR